MGEVDPGALIEAIGNFVNDIDELYGFYLDCRGGFRSELREFDKVQAQALEMFPTEDKESATVEYLDTIPMSFATGDPADPRSVALHTRSQGEHKRRNSPGGLNEILLGRYFVLLVYEFWENEHRKHIASALGYTKQNELKMAIFGDLRLLRHDILHHHGIISDETIRKAVGLRDAQPGKGLVLRESAIDEIVVNMKAFLDDLANKAINVDPHHRIRLRFSDLA